MGRRRRVIVYAGPLACPRRLAPGEVKRAPSRGRVLIGYSVGAPCCGERFAVLPPDVTEHVLGGVARIAGMRATCPRCGATIVVEGQEMVVG